MKPQQSSKIRVIRYHQYSFASRLAATLGVTLLALCFLAGAWLRYSLKGVMSPGLLSGAVTALAVLVLVHIRRKIHVDHVASELRMGKRKRAPLSGAVRAVAHAVADKNGYYYPVSILVGDETWDLGARFVHQADADAVVSELEGALLEWREAAAVPSVRAPKRKGKGRAKRHEAAPVVQDTPVPAMFRIEASSTGASTIRWRRGLHDINPAGVFGVFVLTGLLAFFVSVWIIPLSIPVALYLLVARFLNRYELSMGKELITLRSGPLPPRDRPVSIVTTDVEGAYSEAVRHAGSVVNHSVFVRLAGGANRVVCRGLPPDAADWLQESIEGLVAARNAS